MKGSKTCSKKWLQAQGRFHGVWRALPRVKKGIGPRSRRRWAWPGGSTRSGLLLPGAGLFSSLLSARCPSAAKDTRTHGVSGLHVGLGDAVCHPPASSSRQLPREQEVRKAPGAHLHARYPPQPSFTSEARLQVPRSAEERPRLLDCRWPEKPESLRLPVVSQPHRLAQTPSYLRPPVSGWRSDGGLRGLPRPLLSGRGPSRKFLHVRTRTSACVASSQSAREAEVDV